MTRQEFIEMMMQQHGRAKIADIQEQSTVVPCDCGEPACFGWAWLPLPFLDVKLPDDWQDEDLTLTTRRPAE
jgi:hypothetical protein